MYAYSYENATVWTLPKGHSIRFTSKRNLATGLVLKVPYFWTSNDHIVVLNVPQYLINFHCRFSAIRLKTVE